ncbi:tRNA (adenosine(37)-N6)-threonylcarbamoyltransferase complex ATPase subunit type 1 TsaE [Rothia aerolata]|uniref:tRNA threonylcarbamoyladenosine biosynthesis protein TsaE n=1 Tax=Rothia aerolata TaxID=1812262 RepID=A0A917MS78_9MICC|nr:tRNA (adenosine(37)-N6)-threonylcarbamoyltransferase complex ATPase subunit type 1 TsaE [Rothia aerolata]GGH60316.1 bifunctional tRNA (adenosine(37)-N6)-threonylcarbamoyltransferase complex ATPase subunit type 1 TsaE/phosphotransferase [Rothia aerolata]
MSVLDIDLTGEDHTRQVALALAKLLEKGDLLILTGELGAGKTTFTRSLGEGLGVREGVISPTFVLSRVHPNLPDGPRPGGPDLVHVDAYRLSSGEELDDLDLEYSMDRSVTVIEWGRDKAEHLAESRLDLELTRFTGADLTAGLEFTAERDPWDEEEDEETPSEPRQLRIIGTGPRWEDEAWEKLSAALTSAYPVTGGTGS